MALAQRHRPLWRQVADHYKEKILSGELAPGDRLPPVRAVAAEWGVSQGVAQQALSHLNLAERLVRADAGGTYVEAGKAVPARQRRLRLGGDADGEVLSAAIVPVPGYLSALFGLGDDGEAVRREILHRRPDGTPYLLGVDWYPRHLVRQVPELLAQVPLPAPGGAELIAQRLGLAVDDGGAAAEARRIRDDGRETALLDLTAGAPCLAVIYAWHAGGQVIEYQEAVLPPGAVVEFDLGV